MTNSAEISLQNTDLWAQILFKLDAPKDLCHVGRVNKWFHDFANDNYFWKPIQTALVPQIESKLRWLYTSQKEKKNNVRCIVEECPVSLNGLTKKIEVFFTFLKKNLSNTFHCLFSDGVEMNIIMTPYTGTARNQQFVNCACRIEFLQLALGEGQILSQPFDRIDGTLNGHRRRIWAIGGVAVCEFIFPKKMFDLSKQLSTTVFCRKLQGKMAEVILKQLNKMS